MKNPPDAKMAYALYDFANSSFGAGMSKFLAPLYFAGMSAGPHALGGWWTANAISVILGIAFALVSTWRIGKGQNPLGILSFLASACCAFLLMLAFAVWRGSLLGLTAFVFANAFFIASLATYDSLLTRFSKRRNIHEFSAFGWGVGFLGGIVWTVGIILFQRIFWNFHASAFLFVALLFWSFSFMSIARMKACYDHSESDSADFQIAARGKKTVLLGYGLISQCITVTMLFFGIYAMRELGFSILEIWGCVLFVQTVWVLATIFWSKFVSRAWVANSMLAMVVVWVFATTVLVSNFGNAWIVFSLFLVGIVLGNLQSLMRSQFALAVIGKKTWREFVLFLAIMQGADLIAPVAFWFLSDILWSQKIPLLFSAGLMFVWALAVWIPSRSENGRS